MDLLKIKIPNKEKELLDVWVEGNKNSGITIIFVHGFAVDKHETKGYFDDLVKDLSNDFRIVRFDFSGCGKSQGNLVEKDYSIWSNDLDVVIQYVKINFQGKIYILSQSMGCFITAMLNPDGIEKSVFTGLPNSNTQFIIDSLFMRFGEKPGGKIDFDGVSLLPRSTGKIQKIGPGFWKVLRSFNPKETVESFSKKNRLMIVHPKQDEVVGSKFLSEYSEISGITIKWIDGDHSFTKQEDRKKLIEVIRNFLR